MLDICCPGKLRCTYWRSQNEGGTGRDYALKTVKEAAVSTNARYQILKGRTMMVTGCTAVSYPSIT